MANPISIYVNTFGTNKVSEEKIINAVKENFDLSPG
jgi:S-adenosylmethionine synthetase